MTMLRAPCPVHFTHYGLVKSRVTMCFSVCLCGMGQRRSLTKRISVLSLSVTVCNVLPVPLLIRSIISVCLCCISPPGKCVQYRRLSQHKIIARVHFVCKIQNEMNSTLNEKCLCMCVCVLSCSMRQSYLVKHLGCLPAVGCCRTDGIYTHYNCRIGNSINLSGFTV